MFRLEKDYGNKKFQQIVETAMDLFWNFGYNRVTVEEICEKAPASKNTFYKHFDNKFSLLRFIMKEIFRMGMKQYEEIMEMDTPFEDKVRKIIDLKFKGTEDMSAQFFRDLYQTGDKEIIRLIEEMVNESSEYIFNSLKIFQEKGEIRKDIDLRFVMYFLNNMRELVRDERLSSMYDSPNKLIMELTNFFFYGILPVRERA